MATLSADVRRRHLANRTQLNYPVIASDIIYGGAAVGDNGSGYARPLVAGDPFLGFCQTRVDNSAGAAGAKNVDVYAEGYVWLSVTGIDGKDDQHKPVFATDDATFTSVVTTDASYIGEAMFYDSTTGLTLVRHQVVKPLAKVTAAVVAHDVNATFSDTEVEAALNALGTAINTIITALETRGIVIAN